MALIAITQPSANVNAIFDVQQKSDPCKIHV